jgi:hypothetical protein
MKKDIKRLLEMKQFIKDEKSLLLVDSLVEIQEKIDNIPENNLNYIDNFTFFLDLFTKRLNELKDRLKETGELKC